MGLNVFEPLNLLCGLLMKTMSILYLFGTVNINKVVSPDKKMYFCHVFYISDLLFSSPVQSTGRAIVVTLASALAFAFPSRHF